MPVALVTGSNRNDTIGKVRTLLMLLVADFASGFEVARQLGEKGYTVIICSRSTFSGEAAVDELTTKHGLKGVQCLQLDLTDPKSVEGVAAQFEERVGDTLDVLVNCAGVSFNPRVYDQAIEGLKSHSDFSVTEGLRGVDVQYQDLEDVFRTNVFGQITMTSELDEWRWRAW